MSVRNAYSTLANVKGLKRITSTSATDDAVIERLLGAASRALDGRCHRKFYPRIETLEYDLPDDDTLMLRDDLLSLTSLANGDGTVFSVADLILLTQNSTPSWAIKLRDTADDFWVTDTDGSAQAVIDVLGEWGYHDDYPNAWLLGGTLNEGTGLNASDLTWTVVSGALFSQNQIVKIDSEIMNLSLVATNDISVVKRGDNGSTAATHINGSSVYIWQPVQDIVAACEDIVMTLYNKRFGSSQEGTATITGAGVVIAPSDITAFARSVCQRYVRFA